MKRRDLLRGALALAALPLFMRTAFASDGGLKQRAHLSKAWRTGVLEDRPVLVLIIPADDGDKWIRGKALGEWLNNASDAQLAPLAQVELVCATVADLERLIPGQVQGEPWMVWVDPATTQVVPVSVTLPPPPPPPGDGSPQDWYEAQDAWDAQRVAANVAAIDAALAPALVPVPDAQVPALAQQVRARIVESAPAGAHWANAWGCGTEIEGIELVSAVDCGMGHVPARSRRFLYLFDVAEYKGF